MAANEHYNAGYQDGYTYGYTNGYKDAAYALRPKTGEGDPDYEPTRSTKPSSDPRTNARRNDEANRGDAEEPCYTIHISEDDTSTLGFVVTQGNIEYRISIRKIS